MTDNTNKPSAPDYLLWRDSTSRAGFTVSMNAAAVQLVEEREALRVMPLTQLVTGPAETRLQAAQLGALVAQAMLANPKLESLSIHLDATEHRDGHGKVYETVIPRLYLLEVDGDDSDHQAAHIQVEQLLSTNADGLQQVLLKLLDDRGDEFLPFHRAELAEDLEASQVAGRWSGWTTFARAYPLHAKKYDALASRADSTASASPQTPGATALNYTFGTTLTEEDLQGPSMAVASKTALDALQELDSWLVCAAIATDADMAQSFPHMQKVAEAGAQALRLAIEAPATPTGHLSDDQLFAALRSRGFVVSTWSKDDFDFLDDSDDDDITSLTPDELAAVKELAIAAAEDSLDGLLGEQGVAHLNDWWDEHKQEVLASLPPPEARHERHR